MIVNFEKSKQFIGSFLKNEYNLVFIMPVFNDGVQTMTFYIGDTYR